MTIENKELIRRRQYYFETKQHELWSIASKGVRHKIYWRKREYYDKKYTNSNPRWWKEVNKTRKPNTNTDNDAELANKLNDGFYSVWGGTQQPDNSRFFVNKPAPPKVQLFDAAIVSEWLKQLKTSTPGPDGLSAILLKSSRKSMGRTTGPSHLHQTSVRHSNAALLATSSTKQERYGRRTNSMVSSRLKAPRTLFSKSTRTRRQKYTARKRYMLSSSTSPRPSIKSTTSKCLRNYKNFSLYGLYPS